MHRHGLVQTYDSPPGAVMSLAEAKNHLKVDFDDDDDLIESLIEAATLDCEAYCNAAFVPRTFTLTFGSFPNCWRRGSISLPIHPLISVTSVKYLDTHEDEQTLATGDYVAVSSHRPPFIVIASGSSWPTVYAHPEGVTITFRAGFDPIPANIVAAVKLRLGQLYRYRDEPELELSPACMTLLSPHRMWPL